jgi:diaminopimelate decarboxylase
MFHYEDDRLFVEGTAVAAIAEAYGTPTFIYSRAQIEANYREYAAGFGQRAHAICYAVKANGNLAVLDVLARLGSAFDIVSGGELARVRAAGGELATVTFAGVGKLRAEIDQALAAGIGCFNIESAFELDLVSAAAVALGCEAPVALRVNPDVDANTHPYISTGMSENKFGIPMGDAVALYQRAATLPGVRIAGVACHIGSQLTSIEPIVDAAGRVMTLVGQLAANGITVEHIDIGGGLGIAYGTQRPPPIADYVAAICRAIPEPYRIVIEPGRSIVGDAGLLLTRVQQVKSTPAKSFAICDAAMTELIRPALYQAFHPIVPERRGGATRHVDVVGPVCETADFLGRDRELAIEAGELLAIADCGAYAAVMASNYNARPRPAEVLIDAREVHVCRERESVAALFAGERRLP